VVKILFRELGTRIFRHVSRHGASEKEVRFVILICENLRNLRTIFPTDFSPNLQPGTWNHLIMIPAGMNPAALELLFVSVPSAPSVVNAAFCHNSNFLKTNVGRAGA
jgi:hypothetical protein